MTNLEDKYNSRKAFIIECSNDHRLRLLKHLKWMFFSFSLLANLFGSNHWMYISSALLAALGLACHICLIRRKNEIKDRYYLLS